MVAMATTVYGREKGAGVTVPAWTGVTQWLPAMEDLFFFFFLGPICSANLKGPLNGVYILQFFAHISYLSLTNIQKKYEKSLSKVCNNIWSVVWGTGRLLPKSHSRCQTVSLCITVDLFRRQ